MIEVFHSNILQNLAHIVDFPIGAIKMINIAKPISGKMRLKP